MPVVIGWSMGGDIAQELALLHSDKVVKLVIYASTCGGVQSLPPTTQILKELSNPSGTSLARLQRILPLLFPEAWRVKNPNYLENLPRTSEIISSETLNLQLNAILEWYGTCNQLSKISQPTLIVVRTEDVPTVPANSLLIAEQIHGARLIQMKGGGHGRMFQYPKEFANAVLTFLESETA